MLDLTGVFVARFAGAGSSRKLGVAVLERLERPRKFIRGHFSDTFPPLPVLATQEVTGASWHGQRPKGSGALVFGAIGNPFKLPGLHFHDLRHEAALRLAEKLPKVLEQLSSITGHKGLRMLRRYDRPRAEYLDKEIATLARTTGA